MIFYWEYDIGHRIDRAKDIACTLAGIELISGGKVIAMDNVIDFSKSVYAICKEHPEVIEIMQQLGFKEIASPGMLNTAGRYMTIPRGAKMRGIELDNVKSVFQDRGYKIID